MTSPESLIRSTDCLAQALTACDQSATILLRTTEYDEVVRSLLKFTVLPIHTDALAPCKEILGLEPKDLGAAFSPNESFRIKDFLSLFSFQLSSESGAEYSYYDAIPKSNFITMATTNPFTSRPLFRVELISPASEKQIQRALPVSAYVMVDETPKLYQDVVAPYIQNIIDSGSLAWIENVVTGKKEAERLLLDTKDYVLNIDTKWKSHPDPHTVPKEQWKLQTKAVGDLYCLAIVKGTSLASIRDLRREHIPMLQDILSQCPKVIEQVYGVRYNQMRIFFHYHPQFYRLHVHFTRLENEFGCTVERGHLLLDVIQNLEMDSNYYSNRTLTYKLRNNEALYKLIDQVESVRQITTVFSDEEELED